MPIRQNVLNLSGGDVAKLRRGFAKLQTYPYDDKRGFLFWAGKHGYPDFWCGQHHTPDFLTWHRAYLRAFELALQDAIGDADFGLPYWDWTATGTTALPDVCLEPTYTDEAGAVVPNPLQRTRIVFLPNIDEWTTREDDPPLWWLNEAATQAKDSVALSGYDAMQSLLESGHDGLHGWVGGSMGSVTTAAFDPIFWFHHSNVDRLWATWQDDHPNATIPPEVLQGSLVGFPLSGAQVLDYRALGYSYAATAGNQPVLTEIDVLTAAGKPLSMDFPLPPAGFRSAELVLAQIRHPRDSLQVRIFLDAPDADIATPTSAPAFAGSRFVFGHGDCAGSDSGHCDWRKVRGPLDPRGPHHMKPFDLRVDLGNELRRVAPVGAGTVNVTLVVLDATGDPVPADRLKFETMQLVTKD
jgi:tyrosinase